MSCVISKSVSWISQQVCQEQVCTQTLETDIAQQKNMMCYYNDSVIDQIELSISQKLQKNQKNKGTDPIQT